MGFFVAARVAARVASGQGCQIGPDFPAQSGNPLQLGLPDWLQLGLQLGLPLGQGCQIGPDFPAQSGNPSCSGLPDWLQLGLRAAARVAASFAPPNLATLAAARCS